MEKLLKVKSYIIDCKGYQEDFKGEDQLYSDYIKLNNGGYYFEHGLHIYGYDAVNEWDDILFINKTIKKDFAELARGLSCFAQDVFGNQFAFKDGGVVFFNIETGEQEPISKNFGSWVDTIFNDIDYYTGISLINLLEPNVKEDLSHGFRLCPKYPFVLGGEYQLDNLYLKYFDENIKYNSSIAKQLINLKDGQTINLKILE